MELIHLGSNIPESPNKLTKISVQDRTIFRISNTGTKLFKPDGVQQIIDDIVSQYFKGRSFVIPSESENYVTIYSEAATKPDCDSLFNEITTLIYTQVGGKGVLPNNQSKTITPLYSNSYTYPINAHLMLYNFLFGN